jgi:hypothetical protein
MIKSIIFSRDRACQLRLLLDSMFRNSYKLFDNIQIIFTASSEAFAEGYYKLQQESILPSRIRVNWTQEKNLEQDTLNAMREAGTGPTSFITFLTDDSVFYRNIHDYKFAIESCLNLGSDIACFSLRLGVNTAEQTYWQLGNTIKLNYIKVKDLIKWKHLDYPTSHGYGYPVSLDGHIFRATNYIQMVEDTPGFTGVNSLEGSLNRFKNELQPCIAAFEKSALVTVPINRVQTLMANAAGLFYGISTTELNQRYLAGEVIDYDKIDFSGINGTHAELAYSFRRK